MDYAKRIVVKEWMLKLLINDGAEIKLCGSWVQARDLEEIPLAEGVEVSNMQQLAA